MATTNIYNYSLNMTDQSATSISITANTTNKMATDNIHITLSTTTATFTKSTTLDTAVVSFNIVADTDTGADSTNNTRYCNNQKYTLDIGSNSSKTIYQSDFQNYYYHWCGSSDLVAQGNISVKFNNNNTVLREVTDWIVLHPSAYLYSDSSMKSVYILGDYGDGYVSASSSKLQPGSYYGNCSGVSDDIRIRLQIYDKNNGNPLISVKDKKGDHSYYDNSFRPNIPYTLQEVNCINGTDIDYIDSFYLYKNYLGIWQVRIWYKTKSGNITDRLYEAGKWRIAFEEGGAGGANRPNFVWYFSPYFTVYN